MAMAIFATSAMAQECCAAAPNVIEVVGNSEISLTPDIFYLSITIDEGDSKGRITATQQQERMTRELEKIGIDIAKQLKISSMSSTFERRTTAYSSISYSLMLTSQSHLAAAIEIFDELYISKVSLERCESSHLAEAKSQARQQAIRDAKTAATQLAEAIGQKSGPCINIVDLSNDSTPYASNRVMSVGYTRSAAADSQPSAIPLEVKEIKLTYRVRAQFRL